jgi:site-specific DNA-methyltransferase (adenine-specific)
MSRLVPNRILIGDARTRLTELPDASVDCVVTSPPYFRLRDYQIDGQLGLEPSVDAWVEDLVAVVDELARVLTPTGSLWLNLGDSYARDRRHGAPPKGLVLAPERLLLALADRGWLVRNKVIWAKTNPMPTSVRDRLSCTWEALYFLVRRPDYWFDLDAIRMPHRTTRRPSQAVRKRLAQGVAAPSWAGPLAGSNAGLLRAQAEGRSGHPLGKNPGDVWTLPTAGFRGAHFATFPTALVERPLLATCPAAVCSRCRTPWRRPPARHLGQLAVTGRLHPSCHCHAPSHPGLVLDPFLGSGTVALVAEAHRRDWLGIELNPAFAEIAEERLRTRRREAA